MLFCYASQGTYTKRTFACFVVCSEFGLCVLQVKKFLDSTHSMPDFVELYKNMYLHLKNAMEELFGQQTAFVLALRQGFSAALLQLSILTAMHVSQELAHYIRGINEYEHRTPI